MVTAKEVEQETARQEDIKFVRSAKVLSYPHPVPSMTTFLCESCLEAVQVPSDMLGQELRFKCFVCHQENYYDLTD